MSSFAKIDFRKSTLNFAIRAAPVRTQIHRGKKGGRGWEKRQKGEGKKVKGENKGKGGGEKGRRKQAIPSHPNHPFKISDPKTSKHCWKSVLTVPIRAIMFWFFRSGIHAPLCEDFGTDRIAESGSDARIEKTSSD